MTLQQLQHMYAMCASDNIMYLGHASTCARFVMLENMWNMLMKHMQH
jgi:hypothetical protein